MRNEILRALTPVTPRRPHHADDAELVIDASGLSKTFGANTVLHGVSLAVRSGEIRALLGQNGSGKSTLIKILAGYHEPDSGAAISLGGSALEFPLRPKADGHKPIAFVHQDLGLEPSLSIVDNFWIADGSARPLARIGWRAQRERAAAALRRFGLTTDVRTNVERLPDNERAIVAIARALGSLGPDSAGLLVLDEPTVLLEHEAKGVLFDALLRIRASGCGILFVSHNLDEVATLCDSVSVLRDGRLVAEGDLSDFSERVLIHTILGQDLEELYPPAPRPRTAPVVLRVDRLSAPGVSDVSFELHEGEVLGLCGLAGMGQDTVPQAIYGVDRPRAGEISLFGEPFSPSPRASLARGVVLLPLDRKRSGGHEDSTLYENLTLPVIDRYFRRGRISRSDEVSDVAAILEEFHVKPADPLRRFGELSGGNQQKALLGKWLRLSGNAKVLLLHEPTQGVDVGAKHEIFRLISAATSEGAAVLYCSTEYEDLAHLCDRVLVMRDGRIVAEVDRGHLSASRLEALALARSPALAG